MIRAIDCSYVGMDRYTKKYIVREELYPESRGWIDHQFDNENEAQAWLKKLEN